MEPKPATSPEDELANRQTAPLLPGAAVTPEKLEPAAAETTADAPDAPEAEEQPIVTDGEVESPEEVAVEEAEKPNSEPAPTAVSVPSARHRRFGLKQVVLAVILLNVCLLAGNGFVYARDHKKTSSTATTATVGPKTATKNTDTAAKPAADVKTLHYKSDSLALEFDYPVDWRVASSNDDKTITLTSASFPITNASGEAGAGTISLNITSAADDFGSFMVYDEARIIKDSETLTYAHPTAQQRTQTNLSFVGYPTEGRPAGITAVFVSGGNSYKAGDTVGSKDYKKVDPHVSLYVDLCAAGKCVQSLATSDFSLETWHSNESLLMAKAVIESMRFN